MKKLFGSSAIVALAAATALAAPTAASAATWVTYFDWSNTGSGGSVTQIAGPINDSTAWAKGTVVEGPDMLTFTIELNSALLAGFLNTGSGQTTGRDPGSPGNKQPFSFNADAAYTVTPSNANDPDPLDGNDQTFFYGGHDASVGFENNPFGQFTDFIGCCYAPDDVKNGSVAASPGPLVFTVAGSGISIANIFSNGPPSSMDGGALDGGWWFAADVTTSFDSGSTFTIAARDISCVAGCDVGVPEPGTWTLMILGFGGAGAMLRTRRSRLRTI